ncbi:hypothetical protein [Streptomyces sp. DT171]|uniref:hypothetical protein n=1 Tax=Streptomyces sp. DT171 TaxID=3416524 RepID=UPI003CF8AA3D
MSRRPLPPPPPPVGIRSWPDREALLTDRAVVLRELVRMYVGAGRLWTLWLSAALCALGWSLVGTAIVSLEESYDIITISLGLICVGLGACFMVPSVAFVVAGLREDREVRQLLDEWGGLDRDPEADTAFHAHRVGLVRLLSSYALCALGLYLCVTVPAGAEAGEKTYGMVARDMGFGVIAWLTGLIGVVRALAHRRWVARVLVGGPAVPLISTGGGAHR